MEAIDKVCALFYIWNKKNSTKKKHVGSNN